MYSESVRQQLKSDFLEEGKRRKMLCLARALAITKKWGDAADYVEEHFNFYPGLSKACKAASAASSVADLQGGEYGQVATEFFESLRPLSVFDNLVPHMRITPLDPGTQILAAALPVEGGTVLPRPISKLNFTRDGLVPYNAGTVVAVSRDALEFAYGRDLLSRELAGGTIQAGDKAFLAALAAGVGSNALSASSAGVSADMKTMLDEVTATGAESLFLVVPPTIANSLATADPAAPHIDMTPNGGTVHGVRCLVSANLPAADSTGHNVLLIDAGAIAANPGTMSMTVSDAGFIDLSDDPAGEDLISLFQADCVALMATRLFGFRVVRSSGITLMSGVDW